MQNLGGNAIKIVPFQGRFLFWEEHMKKQLNRNELILVGVMLFSLFFGAGNLIFPPFLGQESGIHTVKAMVGFIVSAVGFPILGVIAVSKTNGLNHLANRVNKKFSFIFTILIYLSIGPLLGIPRAGSLPYEMVLKPFATKEFIPHNLALLLFTSTFFFFAYRLAMRPNKLVDRLGKILTPILLFLIAAVFVASFSKTFPNVESVAPKYEVSPILVGFLDGYQTMDTIAALNFGLVITMIIKSSGINNKKDIVNNTIKAGLLAGLILTLIYSSLAYLGMQSGALFGTTDNGAETLANIILYIFGDFGLFLLATIFTLACLTTAVGLITSISQYFESISKYSYSTWVKIFTLWSLFISNFGLTKILEISVPILNIIYPIALVLIILSIFNDHYIKHTKVYKYSVYITIPIAIIQVFVKSDIFNWIPFYKDRLGWVVPAILTASIVYLYELVKNR